MTKVKYTITIHTSRTNRIRLSKLDLTYHKKPVAAGFDKVQFMNQKVVIGAERNSKRLSLDDMLEYKQSNLYSQIFKSLLCLYLGNGCRVSIRGIDMDTATIHETRLLDRKSQPLALDFNLRKAIPQSTLDVLWDETPKGENLRTVVSHFLKGVTSKDRYFKFERLWRAYEQLAYLHYYHDNIPKSPNGTDAMRSMRTLILSNPAYLQDTLNLVDSIGSRALDKLHWKRLIESHYPYTGSANQLNCLINNLINGNQDYRLCRVFKKARDLRENGLTNHHLLAGVDSTIAGYQAARVKNNTHVLSLIICKYGFFMRNKMFHGHEADFTFCFTNHTEDDDITDFMNRILESFIVDLLCGYNSL